MKTAALTVVPDHTIGNVDRRLFGTFIEHLGRSIYTGIYEPTHPTADGCGFRGDVLELAKDMGISLVRHPGGNFLSGHNWEDGIGPRDSRPTRLDLAWHSVETNEVGINEFMKWTESAEVEVMLVANLGTRGIDGARSMVEYFNYPSGTYWSDLRISHGRRSPYGVKLWALGNELDGPWQIGQKTPDEYGRLATQVAKAMKWVDPETELIACGSSSMSLPSFASWDATVLEHAYEYVDYVAPHSYHDPGTMDLPSFLATACEMDRMIDGTVAACDYVRAKKQTTKRIDLAVDEWNVVYRQRSNSQPPRPWSTAPRLIEDTFNLADMVVVGSLLIALLRHADRVRIACQSQLANVHAPIMTEPGGPAWRQTTFYPFAHCSRFARGSVLHAPIASPSYETTAFGPAALVDAVATMEGGADAQRPVMVSLFAVNRDLTERVALEADLRAFQSCHVVEHIVVGGDDPQLTNDRDRPGRVVPRTVGDTKASEGSVTAMLPPLSWNVIRVAVDED